MVGPVALVGREAELSRLVRALGGDARMVLVTGDAGVGKTRFIGEGMARAAAAGMVTVQGECLPLVGTLPLLPVAAALNELAGLNGGKVLETALETAPDFVRGEVGRLVPQLGSGGGPAPEERGGGWQRERLFAGMVQLLAAVAARSAARVGLVVEDVHWADTETLDFLTFLGRPGAAGAVRVVVTCRSDEAPLKPQVAGWLAQARGAAGTEEITLGPLSRAEVEQQVALLVGGPVAPQTVDELFARAEGNPFFADQLVAAAMAVPEGETVSLPAELPDRLAGLLATRAGRCAGDARVVLNALAVAGRPLDEELLAAVTSLDGAAVRGGLRELAAARLLADGAIPGGGHRPRHALLAEAVAADLLPGERAVLHERTAQALEATSDEALAGEAAGHWQAAGRPAEELPARVAAAEAAERVFGYPEAAAHWLRAIEVWPDVPGGAAVAGTDLPLMYVRAIDALERSGEDVRAGGIAEEAYRQFAHHADPATAAVICYQVARYRSFDSPAAGLPLMEEALRLFDQAPPSADYAEAMLSYANFLRLSKGSPGAGALALLTRALEIAEGAGATALSSRIVARLSHDAFLRGQVEEGFAFLARGWALARASQDGAALLGLAVGESDALLKLARFHSAVDVALRGLGPARPAGLGASWAASILEGQRR